MKIKIHLLIITLLYVLLSACNNPTPAEETTLTLQATAPPATSSNTPVPTATPLANTPTLEASPSPETPTPASATTTPPVANRDDIKKEIEAASQAIEANPDDAEAYNRRAKGYYQLGEYQQALADYNQAIKIDPDYAEAYINLGLTYAALQDYEIAIIHFTLAIHKSEDLFVLGRAHHNRAVSAYHLNQSEKALEDFNQALDYLKQALEEEEEKQDVSVGMTAEALAMAIEAQKLAPPENKADFDAFIATLEEMLE